MFPENNGNKNGPSQGFNDFMKPTRIMKADEGGPKAFEPQESQPIPQPVQPFPQPVQASPEPEFSPAVQVMPEDFFDDEPKMKPIIIICAVVLFLLLVAGAGAVFYYYQSVLPAKSFQSALAKMAEAKSGHVDAELSLGFKSKSTSTSSGLSGAVIGQGQELDLNLKDQTDFVKNQDGSYQLASELSFALPDQISQLLGGKVQNVALSLITVEKDKLFLKLSGLGLLLANSPSLDNMWLFVSMQDAKSNLTAVKGIGECSTSTYLKISSLYNKYDFIKLKSAGQENVNGVMSDRYSASLDKNKLKQFIIATYAIAKQECQSTATEPDIKQLDQYLADLSLMGDFWINQKDGTLAKAQVNGTYFSNEADVKTSLTLGFSNYNQPVEIKAPTDYKNLDDIISGFMSGAFGGNSTSTAQNGNSANYLSDFNQATSSATSACPDGSPANYNKSDLKTDSDADGLPDFWESFFGTDPKNPDTDGDGYKDGDEVQKGYSPMIGGGAKLDLSEIKPIFMARGLYYIWAGPCNLNATKAQFEKMTDQEVFNEIIGNITAQQYE